MKRGLVSIIIPVHNAAKASRCVDALRAQTYRDIEIIEVSGSGFPAEKRNCGFRRSQGEYVFFLDEDEYLIPTVVEECVRRVKTGFDIITIPVRKIVGTTYMSKCLALIKEATWKTSFFTRWVLDKAIGLFDPSFILCDDVEIRHRAIVSGCRIATISGYIIHDERNVSPTSVLRKTILGRRAFRKLREKYGKETYRDIVNASHERRRIISVILSNPRLLLGVSIVMLSRAIIRRIP